MEKVDTISNRIVKAMQIRKMKQADIVEATGIGKSSLSQYISNKCEPKADKIFLISKALNVAENWLMGFDVPMYRTDSLYVNMDDIPALIHEFISDSDNLNTLLGLCCFDDEIEALNNYKKLNEQGRKRLNAYLQELLSLYSDNSTTDNKYTSTPIDIDTVSNKITDTLLKRSTFNADKEDGK